MGHNGRGKQGFKRIFFWCFFVKFLWVLQEFGMKELNNWHLLNFQIDFAASRISSHRVHGDWS